MTDWTNTVQRAKDAEAALPRQGNDPAPYPTVENNTLYLIYYCVTGLDTDGVTTIVLQRGTIQKGELDQQKLDGVEIHETDGWGNIINE